MVINNRVSYFIYNRIELFFLPCVLFYLQFYFFSFICIVYFLSLFILFLSNKRDIEITKYGIRCLNGIENYIPFTEIEEIKFNENYFFSLEYQKIEIILKENKIFSINCDGIYTESDTQTEVISFFDCYVHVNTIFKPSKFLEFNILRNFYTRLKKLIK